MTLLVIVQVLLSFKSEMTLLTFHLPILMNNIFMYFKLLLI